MATAAVDPCRQPSSCVFPLPFTEEYVLFFSSGFKGNLSLLEIYGSRGLKQNEALSSLLRFRGKHQSDVFFLSMATGGLGNSLLASMGESVDVPGIDVFVLELTLAVLGCRFGRSH